MLTRDQIDDLARRVRAEPFDPSIPEPMACLRSYLPADNDPPDLDTRETGDGVRSVPSPSRRIAYIHSVDQSVATSEAMIRILAWGSLIAAGLLFVAQVIGVW
jgi:hypothetical protein